MEADGHGGYVLRGTAASVARAQPVPRACVRRLSLAAVLTATLALAGATPALGAESTGAAENLRTSWYPDEPSLTPSLVSGPSFEQAFESHLQGQILAQPLIADNTLLVATENNWVYALDPNSGIPRWQKQFGAPVSATDSRINCPDVSPNIGITSTPVVDAERGIAYFVANQYVPGSNPEGIAWYMHAVELSTGNEVRGFPVEIKGEAENIPGVEFVPEKQLQRPALLLMNGVVYAGFGSHCDSSPYEGWLIGISTSGEMTTMWATSEAAEGAIWQSGGGLISDAPGQILFSTGNGSVERAEAGDEDPPKGPGDKPPAHGFGQSVVRVGIAANGAVEPLDFFSPFNNVELDLTDLDLGSSAPVALPAPYFGTEKVPHLLVQSGKTGYVYLLNRDNLGGMGQGPHGEDAVVQRLGPYGGVWGGAAAWPGDGGYVYLPAVEGGSPRHLLFFKYSVNGTGEPQLSLAGASEEELTFGSGSPIVTSNGTTNGSAIVWDTVCGPLHEHCEGAELVAYGTVPTSEEMAEVLFKAPIGKAAKFTRPDASDGHVYVGNSEGDLFAFSGPSLTASAQSLAFTSSGTGNSVTREVAFTNTGTRLEVSAVHPPSAPFQASGLPAPGTVIAAGQTIPVRITFDAPTLGSFNGSLGLTTQAGETSVTLAGSASEPSSSQQSTQLVPPPAPEQGVLGLLEAAPDAELAGSSLTVGRGGALLVRVHCRSGVRRCTGTITLRTLPSVSSGTHGRKRRAVVTLGMGSFDVGAGKTAKVRLRLTRNGHALLARARVLRARATVVTHDAAGAAHTATTTVAIRNGKTRTLRSATSGAGA